MRTADQIFFDIHDKCICTLMKYCIFFFYYQDYLGDTPIHKAAKKGNMECVSLLISQGASLWYAKKLLPILYTFIKIQLNIV